MPASAQSIPPARRRFRLRPPRFFRRAVGWLCRSDLRTTALVAALAFALCAGMAAARGVIPPYVADEQSYLLAADTFAHGRLANPPHPLWPHFESVHILQQPTYASMYPPAQGMALAMGQVLTGQACVGVWLGVAFMGGALYWMLRGFAPPRWALLGALIAVLQFDLFTSWSRSYWGGAVAAAGGALLYGALARVVRRWRTRDALVLALGLFVLANSRPFEGLVVSLPALAILAWRLWRLAGPARRAAATRVAVPLALLIAVGAGWIMYYNWRVTHDPFLLPWQLHYRQYSVFPVFIWQNPRPVPVYRHTDLRAAYVGDELNFYRHYLERDGLQKMTRRKLWMLYEFFLGPALALSLLALPWALRDRWVRAAVLILLLLLGAHLVTTATFSHYAAPGAALLMLVLVRCFRWLCRWRPGGPGMPEAVAGGWPVGPAVLATVLVAAVWWAGARFIIYDILPPTVWPMQRQHFIDELTHRGGKHLVLVIDGQHQHEQTWVANAADIDGSPIVWARAMSEAENAKLLEYFAGRTVWTFRPEQSPRRLTRYLPEQPWVKGEEIPGMVSRGPRVPAAPPP